MRPRKVPGTFSWKRYQVPFAAVVLCASTAVGQDDLFLARNEAGLLLERASGARATSLGGAFTAVADDPSALSANPGGLGQLRTMRVMATRDAQRADGEWRGDFQATSLAIAGPVGGGVGGLALATLDYGQIDLIDAAGVQTGTADLRDVAFAASYSSVNPEWFNDGGGWTGATVELVRDANGETRPGVSVGSVVPVTFKTSMAWALEHMGPKLHGGMLPSTLRAGVAFRDNNAAIPVQVGFDAALPFLTGAYALSAGVDARVTAGISLRGGYTLRPGEPQQSGLTGIAGGIGLHMGAFLLDYAYQPSGDLLSTHKVSVTFVAAPPELTIPMAQRRPSASARPVQMMPEPSASDESENADAEPERQAPAVRPATAPAPVKPPVRPAALSAVKPARKAATVVPAAPAKPAPVPAPVKPAAPPAQMPAEIPQAEPVSTPAVPGTSSATPADDGWIGPPPTPAPQMVPEEAPAEPAANPGDENTPVAPIPGAGKTPANKPRMGGI